MAYAAEHLEDDLSLTTLARRAGFSPHHFQRAFAAAVGESPKQLTLRLRLERAASLLLTSTTTVLDIALACGFESHEVFTRTFRRRFRMTPSSYRQRGFTAPVDAAQRAEHAELVKRVGRCIGLYQMCDQDQKHQERTPTPMPYSIEKKDLASQPVLLMRKRVPRSAIAATIGESLPHIFLYAQRHGIALAGLPFARYSDVGPGLLTIEPGMRISPGANLGTGAGEGQILADTLPAGPAAVTLHTGPYDKLSDAYAALELWMTAEGYTPAGAPWESYVNDPSEHPDPKDWQTEVFWPIR